MPTTSGDHVAAAVHSDRLAGHEGGVIRAEEAQGAAEILGSGQPAQRSAAMLMSIACSATSWVASVSVSPGASALTRMPNGASSLARILSWGWRSTWW